MKHAPLAFLVASVLLAVSRFYVPTALDWSVTSVFKDFSHVFIGATLAMVCVDVAEMRRSGWKFMAALGNSPYFTAFCIANAAELFCVLKSLLT